MLTVKQLSELQEVLKISGLAKRAGISEQVLLAKVRRGSELKVNESQSLEAVLRSYGLMLCEPVKLSEKTFGDKTEK
jgi:hypothetical protein